MSKMHEPLISQVDYERSQEAERWQEYINQLVKPVPECRIPKTALPSNIFPNYYHMRLEQQIISLPPLLLQLMKPVGAKELAKLHIGYLPSSYKRKA